MLLQKRDYKFLEACKQSDAELWKNIRTCKENAAFWNETDNSEEICKEKLYQNIFEEVLRRRGRYDWLVQASTLEPKKKLTAFGRTVPTPSEILSSV